MAALFIAQIEGLAADIRDGVVVPRGEAELVRVLAPGVGSAAFRDDRAKVRIRQHIHPRGGRDLSRLQANDVLVTVGREAAETVEEQQVLSRKLFARHIVETAQATGNQVGNLRVRPEAAFDLLGQSPFGIDDDCPRDRQQQHTIFIRQLLFATNENAARSIQRVSFGPGRDQPDDQVLQHLSIARKPFVPDDQIDRKSLKPPEGMRMNELSHEVDLLGIADAQNHDRQVAGDAVSPQARLPAPVLQQRRLVRAA